MASSPLMTRLSVTLYGIPNCDTVKQARAWLAAQGVEVVFHDFKKLGVPAERLPDWIAAVGWEALLNRRGTTWRKLDEASRQAIDNETGSAADSAAIALMQAQPSLIRRPLIAHEDAQGRSGLLAGFDAAQYTATLLEVQP